MLGGRLESLYLTYVAATALEQVLYAGILKHSLIFPSVNDWYTQNT